MKFSTKILLFFFQFTILTLNIQSLDDPINPYDFLHIIPNPDGSITRIKEYFPTVPPNSSTSLAFSKDVPLNPDKKTWVRVFLPNKTRPEPMTRLPIVIFAHGGDFILLSAASPQFDTFCADSARQLNVLVVSVEYRLAPEHRLPAAYDDVLETVFWVKEKKDEWVSKYGDVTRCILMGESAGGNIAYNVGLQASVLAHELTPLVIKGLVLVQPFFGGTNIPRVVGNFPSSVVEFLWHISLPIGAKPNNPYFNPMFGGGSSNLNKFKELGWEVVIAGCDGDGLFWRQVDVSKFLKTRGVNVTSLFSKGYYHGVFVSNVVAAHKLFDLVRSVFHLVH